ncbi:MAG: PAC2 family protein [Nanoarchaeota archaeon]
MHWDVKTFSKEKLSHPVLIEGLPGIGNVGKVAVDYLVDQVGAKRYAGFFSTAMPNTVFVNEHNLVELPALELYSHKTKGQDILFLVGNTQPVDESSCYTFCETLLDLLQEMNCKEIITLGGIGLPQLPKEPKVYITGNKKAVIRSFKNGLPLQNDIYGVVGPIVGVTGLLVGLAEKRKIAAVALLAETLGHPLYLGLRGAKALLKVLKKRYSFPLTFHSLDQDIKEIESELQDDMPLQKRLRSLIPKETNYIG